MSNVSINLRLGISRKPADEPPQSAAPPLWRVLHEAELPADKRGTPLKMPEVRPFFPNHHVPFDEGHQRLSYEINRQWLTPDKWTAVYGYDKVITNNQGFGDEGSPRANYIVGKDLDCELPKVECLTCGGNIHTGYIDGADFVVQTLSWRNAPPTVEWLRAHPWFCVYLVSVDGGLTPRRFPQGEQPNGYMADIIHPFMGDPERYPRITMPAWRVVRWMGPTPPDPYRVYLPQ